MSRAALIVASILMLVAPAVVAADPTDPLTTAPPAIGSSPPADSPAIVVEPSPANEVRPIPAPPAPVAPPRPTEPAPAPTATVATATVPPAPARLKRERHGLAILGGLGITYAALGGQLRYDIPVRRSLTVSPFVSAGIMGYLPGPIGIATGLGARHRLVVDLGVVPLEREELYLHGTTITERTIFGPMAAAGYEHISDGGWIQRCTFEYAYTAWGSVTNYPGHHVIFSSFGFGWRAW